jgi:hypothetical protein
LLGRNNDNDSGPPNDAEEDAGSHEEEEVVMAAATAQEMLLQTVPCLPVQPVQINDTHVIRSFGQLHVEPRGAGSGGDGPIFSTAHALYPVGFSCDRFEFIPVHGRVLKMRCSIIDGGRLQREGVDVPDPTFRVANSLSPSFKNSSGVAEEI